MRCQTEKQLPGGCGRSSGSHGLGRLVGSWSARTGTPAVPQTPHPRRGGPWPAGECSCHAAGSHSPTCRSAWPSLPCPERAGGGGCPAGPGRAREAARMPAGEQVDAGVCTAAAVGGGGGRGGTAPSQARQGSQAGRLRWGVRGSCPSWGRRRACRIACTARRAHALPVGHVSTRARAVLARAADLECQPEGLATETDERGFHWAGWPLHRQVHELEQHMLQGSLRQFTQSGTERFLHLRVVVLVQVPAGRGRARRSGLSACSGDPGLEGVKQERVTKDAARAGSTTTDVAFMKRVSSRT